MPDIVGRLRTPRLAAAPSSPAVGEVYYDTGTNILYWWNGTSWVSASGGGAGSADLVYNGSFPTNTPYTDGDIVVSNGVAYMCVRPTSAAPTPWVQAGAGDLVYNGAFPSNTPYTDGDIVIQNGITYLCVRPTSAAPTPWPLGQPGIMPDSAFPSRLKADTPYITNLDTTWEAGFYAFTSTATGRPADVYGMMQVYTIGGGSGTNIRQVVYQYNGDYIWMRRKTDGGAWGAWITLWPHSTAFAAFGGTAGAGLPFNLTTSTLPRVMDKCVMVTSGTIYCTGVAGHQAVEIGIDGAWTSTYMRAYNDSTGGIRKTMAPAITPITSLAAGAHTINFRNAAGGCVGDGGDWLTCMIHGAQ